MGEGEGEGRWRGDGEGFTLLLSSSGPMQIIPPVGWRRVCQVVGQGEGGRSGRAVLSLGQRGQSLPGQLIPEGWRLTPPATMEAAIYPAHPTTGHSPFILSWENYLKLLETTVPWTTASSIVLGLGQMSLPMALSPIFYYKDNTVCVIGSHQPCYPVVFTYIVYTVSCSACCACV